MCHSNASCTNNEGSYSCECLEGFSGDGFNCSSMSEYKVLAMLLPEKCCFHETQSFSLLLKMLMNVWMQTRITAVLMPCVLIPLEVISAPVQLAIWVTAFSVAVSAKMCNLQSNIMVVLFFRC